MNYKFILLLLFVAAFCSSGIRAQVKQVTIIDNLEMPAPGEGNIKIISDSKITELIGLISPELSVDQANYVKTSGFRIQVFMSNNSRTAKKEMMDKGSLIKGAFPDIATYQGYDAPNWKLLVGDFRTRDEADIFRKQLQKTIPELGKEMYIVRDIINIPIQN